MTAANEPAGPAAADPRDAVVVRVAAEADIPEMHRIRLAVRENRLSGPGVVRPEDYVAMLAEHGRGWVAEVDGRPAGFAIVDLARHNVWALFVDPDREARGVGRRLHHAMMAWAFAAGADLIHLGTAPGTRAERFYRAAGWTYAGPEPNGEVRFEMTREQWFALSPGDEG